MSNVIFNSGFIGFLIWLLLFAVSTAELAIAIRCAWSLRKPLFATAAFKEKLIPLGKGLLIPLDAFTNPAGAKNQTYFDKNTNTLNGGMGRKKHSSYVDLPMYDIIDWFNEAFGSIK